MTTNEIITKKFDHEILGPCQMVVTSIGELPEGFILPGIGEMTQDGPEMCDHPCDFEHEQEVDGRHFITSVIWTSDGGYGAFPEGTELIGCQWLGRIHEWHEPVSHWDNGWSEVVEVILDCDPDKDERTSVEVTMGLLSEAICGEF